MLRCLRAWAFASALGVAATTGVASAADFDGKQTLVCAFESVAECDLDSLCETIQTGDIDLPDSIQVDFKGRRLRSHDGSRSSPIHSTDVTDAVLIAQGSQNGRGWSMSVDRENGHMTGTIVETAGAIVLAGKCEKAP
jgi:hypothetical protein